MFSIPYVLKSEESSFRGPADANSAGGGGESSADDFWGIMNGISGIAGDVATTLNSLQTKTGKGGTPVSTPTTPPPDPNKPNYLLYAGGAVVVLVLVWMLKKGR